MKKVDIEYIKNHKVYELYVYEEYDGFGQFHDETLIYDETTNELLLIDTMFGHEGGSRRYIEIENPLKPSYDLIIKVSELMNFKEKEEKQKQEFIDKLLKFSHIEKPLVFDYDKYENNIIKSISNLLIGIYSIVKVKNTITFKNKIIIGSNKNNYIESITTFDNKLKLFVCLDKYSVTSIILDIYKPNIDKIYPSIGELTIKDYLNLGYEIKRYLNDNR